MRTTTILGCGHPLDLVERMLRMSGRRIDMSTPFVDGQGHGILRHSGRPVLEALPHPR